MRNHKRRFITTAENSVQHNQHKREIIMKIAIIGSGNMGRGVGKIWARAGHRVIFTDAIIPADQLAEIAAAAGETASTAAVADAAADAEVILLTVRWTDMEAAVTGLGDVTGKVILSTVNALKPDMSGLAIGTTTSAAEEIAKLVPNAQVVECILPFAEVLHAENRDFANDKPTVFYCGDHDDAKAAVLPLIDALGVHAVDAGPLRSARYIEPAGMLLVQLAYGQGMGGQMAYKLLQR